MLTRCQIGFYAQKTDKLKNPLVLIYKHSDGYEEGILPQLIEFHKLFIDSRGYDEEYYPARLIQFLTNHSDKELASFTDRDKKIVDLLGYGISQGLHGDIEYYYAIYENRIEVYKVPFDSDYKDFQLIRKIEF